MKGLILSGGLGTRLRPLTLTHPKQIIPIANKPIIYYAIEAMVACQIAEIGIIVGDRGEEVKQIVGNGERWGVNITYIHQQEPLGLAHAVKIAEDFIGRESFILFLGDNLISGSLQKIIEDFQQTNALILVSPVQDPSRYGIAELNGDEVVSLVEKPKHPKSNLALVGVYLFDHHIFEAVKKIQPSWRDEYEITDAIQWLVEQGYKVKPSLLTGWWKDTGKVEDVIDANRLILENINIDIKVTEDRGTEFVGHIVVPASAKIVNSVIRGPVIIGANTTISNSYIGPYTSVGDNCQVINSEVENSILMPGCKICNVPQRLDKSLIGVGARVNCAEKKLPNTLSVILSDYSCLLYGGKT